ncbi:MAG: TlyA family RNA methyltransferase [Clostridiales bacterium]|jgi:23S rRNA (cytidine1920-2'-O)/16S rRNA (cytidine1409-2'-O)-methyltransferase|nr:TlyA family RNA methyltransferase [Clostridiales bacterium]
MIRADVLVALREKCSRQTARRLIEDGLVFGGGRKVDKPGAKFSETADLTIAPRPSPYVSRGGLKLEGALDYFHISPADKICGDIGASTGGFTDCLLRRGAKRVYAVDNGRDQLHPDLRCDARVVSLEKTNMLSLTWEKLGEHCELITVDVSFISVTRALPAVKELLTPDGRVLCLVKPQFEAGPGQVNKRGVIINAKARENAVKKVARLARELGFTVSEAVPAPIRGGNGNIEYFLALGMAPMGMAPLEISP